VAFAGGLLVLHVALAVSDEGRAALEFQLVD